MMSKEQVEARRETNHRYYTKNSAKWGSFYPKSTTSQLGTGNLGGHRAETFEEERILIDKELVYLGLRRKHDV